jgi:hypothetical protein
MGNADAMFAPIPRRLRSQKAVRRKAPPVKISAHNEAEQLEGTTKDTKSTKEDDE